MGSRGLGERFQGKVDKVSEQKQIEIKLPDNQNGERRLLWGMLAAVSVVAWALMASDSNRKDRELEHVRSEMASMRQMLQEQTEKIHLNEMRLVWVRTGGPPKEDSPSAKPHMTTSD